MDKHLEGVIAYVIGQNQFTYIDFGLSEPIGAYDFPKKRSDWVFLIAQLWKSCPEWLEGFVKVRRLGQGEVLNNLWTHLEFLIKNKGSLILAWDERYPNLLKEVDRRPLALNILGDARQLNQWPNRAVVGSRKAAPHALRESFLLGQHLARNGINVVSGGAYGCDIAAHHGALATLRQPLPAVVVFAGGLEHQYPKGNQHIFGDILREGGLLVSERLCHVKARAMDFPIRNRIVAGMSESVMIMQAGASSGAQITAKLSLDYGRDTFVLLHDPEEVRADGSHGLMMDGALGFDGTENYIEKSFLGYRVIDSELT